MSCAQKKRRERRRTESLGSVAVPVLGAHHATERLHSARVRITMTRGSARCAARGWGCGAEFTATERRAKVNVDPHVSGVLYLLYTAVDVKLFSREKFGRPWSFLTGLAVDPSRPAGALGPDVSVHRDPTSCASRSVPLGARSRVTKP
jgi:hypothetical protein